MKVLVVPDIHLKNKVLDAVEVVLEKQASIDKTVFLGDIVDDWGKQNNLEVYTSFFDRLFDFIDKHPDCLWCWGNHDVSYMDYDCQCSGHSYRLHEKIEELMSDYKDLVNPKFVQEVDGVLFSHGGVSAEYYEAYKHRTLSDMVNSLNQSSFLGLWFNDSPLWLRPFNRWGYPQENAYAPIYQVAGHTPVKDAYVINGTTWLVDLFSTRTNGDPFGGEYFIIFDTITKTVSFVNTNGEIFNEVPRSKWKKHRLKL